MANLILTNTADNNKDKTTRLIRRERRIETQTLQEPLKHDGNSQPKNQGTCAHTLQSDSFTISRARSFGINPE